jgi:protein-L-isoaspartate(D-aspartate) O-methyltransferase
MDFIAARAGLVKLLELEIRDKHVLAVMSRIPREYFIPENKRHLAYENGPVPIGYGQTISQPYIIALMTEALELKGRETVLELGTGSGYQTAIIAELVSRVVTVERIPALAESAEGTLRQLGYNNIEVHLAEETLGWKAGAPYDAIIVTAGAPSVPADLLEQLAIGGRMVIPVGPRFSQELLKIIKGPTRNTSINLGGCRFVSLIGKDAWDD